MHRAAVAGVDPDRLEELERFRALALRTRTALERYECRESELSVLFETAQDLTRIRDVDRLPHAIVRRARRIVRTDVAYIALIDRTRRDTYMKVTDGMSSSPIRNTRLPIGVGLGGLVAETGVPYATSNFWGDERFSAPGYSPAATLWYYFDSDRTDPDGPNMSNSVAAILSAQLDPCRTQHYLDQSAAPYVRGPYHFQAETRGVKTHDNYLAQSLAQHLTQPAWIFVTGAAGFLQGLLYGPTGLRWTETGSRLDPMLPSGFPNGMTIRDIAIRGSKLDVEIQPATTIVSLTSGPATTINTPTGPQTVTQGTPLHLTTRQAC